MRLRTKFLLASLLISAGLTTACLLLVQKIIGTQARNSVLADLRNSVQTFENIQRQREASRVRSVRLVADLPIVRALMTTEDRRTIQDASEGLWRIAEADLFVLADRNGKLMALHSNAAAFDDPTATTQMQSSLQNDERTHWWFGSGRLYEVSVHPIYFGSAQDERTLGYIALGYEIDDNLVRQLSQVAGSEVAFLFGNTVVRSTLPAKQRTDLIGLSSAPAAKSEIVLDGDRFLVDTLELNPNRDRSVSFAVLKSLDKATAAMRNLTRVLMITGVIAVICGAILVFFISHTFTRPLQKLVAGVRALGRGDYEYPLPTGGNDEVAELTASFGRMRTNLQQTQRELIENEKLATIGRMSSSISHDLRHHLVAIVANAEFLVDPRRGASEREELYGEVRAGVTEMNELLESLLEFSRTRASLRLDYCNLQDVIEHAAQTSRMHPSYHNIPVTVNTGPECEGQFDCKKLERVFHNLLLNSLAAVAPTGGAISITVRRVNGSIEVRVADEGPGIPAEMKDRIFEPFFSSGKENGTGLGLSVAQKIVQDHNGELRLESTSSHGTVFLVSLPVKVAASATIVAQG